MKGSRTQSTSIGIDPGRKERCREWHTRLSCSGFWARFNYSLDTGYTLRKQVKFPANKAQNRDLAVLDLMLKRIVNDRACRLLFRPAHGAIAQLGERVVRNDEVGGSIPPGSTNFLPAAFPGRFAARRHLPWIISR